jgi:hypothetical protein
MADRSIIKVPHSQFRRTYEAYLIGEEVLYDGQIGVIKNIDEEHNYGLVIGDGKSILRSLRLYPLFHCCSGGYSDDIYDTVDSQNVLDGPNNIEIDSKTPNTNNNLYIDSGYVNNGNGTLDHEKLLNRLGVGSDNKAWHLSTDDYDTLMEILAVWRQDPDLQDSLNALLEPKLFSINGDIETISSNSFDGSSNHTFQTKVVGIQHIPIIRTDVQHQDSILEFESAIKADRVFNAVYNDYAECFDIGERGYDYYKYKIVEINKNKKVNLANKESYKVVGIVSSSYAFLLNGTSKDITDNKKVPVAMSGTVYVDTKEKINNKAIGKLVYSDDDGYALSIDPVKSKEMTGRIVGKIIGIDKSNNRYKIIVKLK